MVARLRIPLGVKVFLVLAGMSSAVSLVVGTMLYHSAKNSLRQEVRAALEGSASAIASQIDPDVHSTLRSPSDEGSEAYRRILAALRRARDENPRIRNVYTMRPTSDPNTFVFVVDGSRDVSDLASLGERYDIRECPNLRTGLDGPAADREPTIDKWGTWLSGYAPIRRSGGKARALVGVDMSLKQLQHEESSLRRLAARSAVLAFLIASALSLLITKVLLKSVRLFVTAADHVSHGDLGACVTVQSRDEIGDFADAFNGMVVRLKESRDRLLEATSRDTLTGLYNHVYFQERFADEVERARRHGRQLSVAIIDLDRFKSINDTLGHLVGDSIVKQLADLLKSSVREADVVARYGGDEFAVIAGNSAGRGRDAGRVAQGDGRVSRISGHNAE